MRRDDKEIAELLGNARTIAMVGASDRPDRASFGVMKFLQGHGYRVLPVNPTITGEHVHGEYVWRELSQIGEPIDIVDIFRNSHAAGEAVDPAWSDQSRGCGKSRSRRPESGDEPLPENRDRAARASGGRRAKRSLVPRRDCAAEKRLTSMQSG